MNIHTNIDKETYNKLLVYGNGILNQGIKTLIELVEKKEIRIVVETNVYL